MKKQTVMWTALPNGVITPEGGGEPRLRLCVFVSPRLQTDEGLPRPLLSQFPDLIDWPGRMQDVSFTVQFDSRPPVEAQLVSPPALAQGTAQEMWSASFHAATYVEPYEFPETESLVIQSFPVRNVLNHIKSAIQAQVLEAPTTPPRVDPRPLAPTPAPRQPEPLQRFLQEIAPPRTQSVRMARQIDTQLRSARIKAAPSPTADAVAPGQVRVGAVRAVPGAARLQVEAPQAQVDFLRLQIFHRSSHVLEHLRATGPRRVPITPPELDFHEIIASMADFPLLLRYLGLAFDLEVPLSAAPSGEGWVSVNPAWEAELPTSTSVSPRTRCTTANGNFRAVPGPNAQDLRDGMLRLDDAEGFEVGQVDVDGAAIKTLDLAATVQDPDEEITDAAMPALRSAGLWAARIDRGVEYAALTLPRLRQMEAQVQNIEALSLRLPRGAMLDLPARDEVRLYAEDLVRGYRVDVWDETTGQWRSLCERVGDYHFSRPEAGVDRRLSIDDEGWISLAATQSAEDDDDDLYIHETLFHWDGWSLCAPRPGRPIPQEGVAPDQRTRYGLDVEFRARPGSLPRLRFGHRYRLRARAVDLAGNGLTLAQAGDTSACEPVAYDRQEPLSAPIIVPRQDMTGSPGESVDRMVIRSFNDTPPRDQVTTDAVCERHVLAPGTSQQMAETHGMFDTPGGMRGDAATYDLIVSRDGQLPNFHDAATLALPYLPDPLAVGVTVRFTRGGRATGRVRVPFTGDWPDPAGFRIEAAERTPELTAPVMDERNRVLTVPLEKGEVAEVVLSCYMRQERMENMGIWRWTVQGVVEPAVNASGLPAAQRLQLTRDLTSVSRLTQLAPQVRLRQPELRRVEELNREAAEGLVWMITPSRTITLVHAVQQPLVTPDLSGIAAGKQIGETFATITGSTPVDGKSTQQIDVLARWEEPVDNITEPEPRIIQAEARVFDVQVSPDATSANLAEPIRLAQARVPDVRVTPRVPAALAPVTPGLILARTGRRHEFGDTRYRRVWYRGVATTRFREYLPFTDEQIDSGEVSITRTGEEVAVDVLNSARPASPKILYVVPTFAWERQDTRQGYTSTRKGGGLRVYLQRPWYSSGDGELLGVVLATAADTAVTAGPAWAERLAALSSRWGKDPLWRTGDTSPALAPRDFPLAAETETGLSLEEVPGPRVAVAGHQVGFDPDRQLWYCDIVVDPGASYYPFIRLALARYQPRSVRLATGDCKLSRVVMADFAQLAPDRTATVSYVEGNPRAVIVSVSGPAAGASAHAPNQLEVSVETSQTGTGDDARWLPAAGPVELGRVAVRGRMSSWNGTVELPADRGTRPFRLAVKEYEVFPSDTPTAVAVVTGVPTVSRRLVYADTIVV